MTLKRLEELRRSVPLSPTQGWKKIILELIDDNIRLRSELNAIAGKAKEALDG